MPVHHSNPNPKPKSNRYYLRNGSSNTDFKFGQHSEGLWATKIQGVWLIVRAIIFQDFEPRGSDPPTSQTDRGTTCNRKIALCTIVHRAGKKDL